MNVTDFKAMVAGFMTRSTTDFVHGTTDQLLLAINNARREAQQRYTFKRFAVDSFIKTSVLGADISTAKLTPEDGGTLIPLKSVDGVWEFQTRAIPAGTFYERTAEVDFRKEREMYANLPLAGATVTRTPNNYLTSGTTGRIIGWFKGQKIYTNVDTATWYSLSGTQLLPDLAGSETSDFFIDNGQSWLLFATAQILNGFLKEDQRVVISERALEASWTKLTQFDGDIHATDGGLDLE